MCHKSWRSITVTLHTLYIYHLITSPTISHDVCVCVCVCVRARARAYVCLCVCVRARASSAVNTLRGGLISYCRSSIASTAIASRLSVVSCDLVKTCVCVCARARARTNSRVSQRERLRERIRGCLCVCARVCGSRQPGMKAAQGVVLSDTRTHTHTHTHTTRLKQLHPPC